MSIKVMSRVWAHSQRKDGELLVMLALADFSNDAGESWPSIPVLAAKARLTERQTRRVLIKLDKAQEIRRVRSNGGRNRRNHYFITLSENPDKITGKELQGKNYPEMEGTKTLTPVSGALNRHRTVKRKEREDGSPSLSTFSVSVEKIIHRLNELSGKAYSYGVDETINKNLLDRLKEGATLADCLLVIEDRWRRWGDDQKMYPNFNPDTLFKKKLFNKYVQEARAAKDGADEWRPPEEREAERGRGQ